MDFVPELIKLAKLRNWQEIDFLIESERQGPWQNAISAGEHAARIAKSRAAPDELPADLAAAVWHDLETSPAGPGVRKGRAA